MGEASFFARFLWLDAATRSYYVIYSSYTVNSFRVQEENALENVLFLHFSLVSVQFDISRSAGLICRSQVAGCSSLFHQYRKYPKHS